MKPGRAPGDDAEVDVGGERLALGVHLEHGLAADDVRRPDRDLAVEAAGAQQRRVEDVRTVRGGDQDDAALDVEAVHLDEQLVQRLLALVVTAAEPAPRCRPTASISSTKMIAGALDLACSNRSRTREAPTPTNISTKSEPEIE